MKIITKVQEEKLLANHRSQREFLEQTEGDSEDLKPVVKLFDAFGQAFWLLTEMDEEGRAFGLCDLGLGFPELGYVDVNELKELESFGCPSVERDTYFEAKKTLSAYLVDAKAGVRP